MKCSVGPFLICSGSLKLASTSRQALHGHCERPPQHGCPANLECLVHPSLLSTTCQATYWSCVRTFTYRLPSKPWVPGLGRNSTTGMGRYWKDKKKPLTPKPFPWCGVLRPFVLTAMVTAQAALDKDARSESKRMRKRQGRVLILR